jgi:molecular chaperone HscB
LQGQALGLENNTAMPAAFLMHQMEWREALEEARAANDESVLLALQKQVQTYAQQRQSELAQQLDEAHNVTAAAALVRELLFVDKFSQDLDAALDRLYS